MNEQNSHPENPHRKVGVFYCAITSIIEQSRATKQHMQLVILSGKGCMTFQTKYELEKTDEESVEFFLVDGCM